MSPTYGYVTELFLESEFQHKGNKQTKKKKKNANSQQNHAVVLAGTDSEKKIFKYYTERDKKYLDKLVIIRTGTYL